MLREKVHWRARPRYSNRCLALFCRQRVAPPRVFCKEHWNMLPGRLQKWFAEAYYLNPRGGVFNPSIIKKLQRLTRMVAKLEGRPVP